MEDKASKKQRILFLCTGNSCRSQMAEAWTRVLRGDEFVSYSAGVEPSGINPFAVKVMQEAGVDLSGQDSVHINDVPLSDLDLVISVCDHARATCPTLPHQVCLLHRPFDDPPALSVEAKTEEEALVHYRRVRDEIRNYVQEMDIAIG